MARPPAAGLFPLTWSQHPGGARGGLPGPAACFFLASYFVFLSDEQRLSFVQSHGAAGNAVS